MKDKPKVIVLKESVTESIIKDVFSFITLASLVGLGVYLGSAALLWVGIGLFVLMLAGVGSSNRMTIQQAREMLDELEAEE